MCVCAVFVRACVCERTYVCECVCVCVYVCVCTPCALLLLGDFIDVRKWVTS